MPDRMPIEAWVLAAFVGSCVGMGFATGYVARRHAWGSWTIGLGSIAIALLWPIIAFVAFVLTSSSSGECEGPCDGPVYVFTALTTIVMPFLFVLSFVLAVGGALVAWLRFRPDAPPNKSLHASRGSVFRKTLF